MPDPEVIAAVSELVALSVRVNRPGFHVLANYSGHVDGLGVRVYPLGWPRCEPVERQVYLDGPNASTPRAIREVIAWLQSLSDRAGMERCPRCGPKPTIPPARPRSNSGRDRVRAALSASPRTTADVAGATGLSRHYAYMMLRELERTGEAGRAGRRMWRKPEATDGPPSDP